MLPNLFSQDVVNIDDGGLGAPHFRFGMAFKILLYSAAIVEEYQEAVTFGKLQVVVRFVPENCLNEPALSLLIPSCLCLQFSYIRQANPNLPGGFVSVDTAKSRSYTGARSKCIL